MPFLSLFQTNKNYNKVSLLIIACFFTIYLFYIFNESIKVRHFSLVFILIFLYDFFKKKQLIKPSKSLIFFSVISVFTITLSYYLLDRLGSMPLNFPIKTYTNIINQYIWFVPFILLPSIFHIHKFKTEYLYKTLLLISSITLIYVTYYNLYYDFNREKLAEFFDPIITYDITFIAVSVLVLCYSFYLKGKSSYIYLTIGALSIFTLILHGSRGTWLGIPLVLLILASFYFRSQTKKIALLILLFISFIGINLIIPNSPVLNRVDDFQQDKNLIENQSFQNSTGTRLLLWQNSIELFKEKPLLGVSIYEIELNNCRLFEEKKIPQCFQHQHSIYFQELAANGLIGLLGLLMTLLIPLIYFVKNIFTENNEIKMLSISGSLFVMYYAISGLTEYYLFFLNTTYIYFLIVATIISFIQLQLMNNSLYKQ